MINQKGYQVLRGGIFSALLTAVVFYAMQLYAQQINDAKPEPSYLNDRAEIYY